MRLRKIISYETWMNWETLLGYEQTRKYCGWNQNKNEIKASR